MKDIKCQVCLEDEDEVSPQVTSRHQHNEVQVQDEPSRRDHFLESCHPYGDHGYVKKKKLSHGGLWGSNPQDFVKQAQSRKAFHLVEVRIVIIELKWNAQV